MIRPLRRRHRTIFVVLALVLPALCVAGLAFRRPIPPTDLSALGGGMAHPTGTPLFLAGPELWSGLPIRTSVFSDSSRPGVNLLMLEALAELKSPELLVYWTTEEISLEHRLPEDVWLLGVFRRAGPPAELKLPAAATRTRGTLLLYGLARQEIAGRAALPIIAPAESRENDVVTGTSTETPESAGADQATARSGT